MQVVLLIKFASWMFMILSHIYIMNQILSVWIINMWYSYCESQDSHFRTKLIDLLKARRSSNWESYNWEAIQLRNASLRIHLSIYCLTGQLLLLL